MNTEKSPEAFRTISEVADWLGTPTHVLRFWESRFREIKPVKRAGGRRYYRPADMELLGGIKRLLHEDGMTIRGVQKLLREQGVRRVADLSPPLTLDGLPTSRGAQDTAVSRDRPAAVSNGSAAHPERPGPPWPPDEMPTPLSAGMSAGSDSAPAQAEPPRYAAAPWPESEDPSTEGPATEGAEAGMVEDAADDADRSAEIVPFVLDTRLRADLSETPDLFDTPAPDHGAAVSSDTPDPRSGNAASRLPAIPPDPDDAAPLSPAAHRPLRGFRRPSGRPGDRLAQLYEKLSSLHGRMPRG